MRRLRESIQRAGLEAAYREGRSLSFRAIVTLAMAQVDTVDRAVN